MKVSDALLKEVFLSCLRIRMIEESIADRYAQQEMRCPTHLSVGQELAGAVVGQLVSTNDLAFSTHRSHAHYLGKGGSLKGMLAEIHGKETGCCRGMGGSMHLRDGSVGFEASTAIVGNSVPVGVGAALASAIDGSDEIAVVFLGDALFETGVFFESLNIAATFDVPVLFVCENNKYSVYSPMEVRQPKDRRNFLAVEALGIKSSHVDGMNAESAVAEIAKAVSHCREERSPYFVELTAYRWREHCGPNFDNHIGYRTEEEYLAWRDNDYLEALERKLLSQLVISEAELKQVIANFSAEIDDAFEFARRSPYPTPQNTRLLEYA